MIICCMADLDCVNFFLLSILHCPAVKHEVWLVNRRRHIEPTQLGNQAFGSPSYGCMLLCSGVQPPGRQQLFWAPGDDGADWHWRRDVSTWTLPVLLGALGYEYTLKELYNIWCFPPLIVQPQVRGQRNVEKNNQRLKTYTTLKGRPRTSWRLPVFPWNPPPSRSGNSCIVKWDPTSPPAASSHTPHRASWSCRQQQFVTPNSTWLSGQSVTNGSHCRCLCQAPPAAGCSMHGGDQGGLAVHRGDGLRALISTKIFQCVRLAKENIGETITGLGRGQDHPALPLGKKLIKVKRKATFDGWEREIEDEERAFPTTKEQIKKMHQVFRNNLYMCLISFPQQCDKGGPALLVRVVLGEGHRGEEASSIRVHPDLCRKECMARDSSQGLWRSNPSAKTASFGPEKFMRSARHGQRAKHQAKAKPKDRKALHGQQDNPSGPRDTPSPQPLLQKGRGSQRRKTKASRSRLGLPHGQQLHRTRLLFAAIFTWRPANGIVAVPTIVQSWRTDKQHSPNNCPHKWLDLESTDASCSDMDPGLHTTPVGFVRASELAPLGASGFDKGPANTRTVCRQRETSHLMILPLWRGRGASGLGQSLNGLDSIAKVDAVRPRVGRWTTTMEPWALTPSSQRGGPPSLIRREGW